MPGARLVSEMPQSLPYTTVPPETSPAPLFMLHGCRAHVAGAAWARQPCSLIRCCRGGR